MIETKPLLPGCPGMIDLDKYLNLVIQLFNIKLIGYIVDFPDHTKFRDEYQLRLIIRIYSTLNRLLARITLSRYGFKPNQNTRQASGPSMA